MPLFSIISNAAAGVGVLAFCVSYLILLKKPLILKSFTGPFILWGLIVLFEFYFLGENSFVYMNEEGELAVPHLYYLAHLYPGGTYSHNMGIGADVETFIVGAQFFSLDVLLFSLFPIWVSILIHKIIVLGTGMVGTYLLCKSFKKSDRSACIAAAIWFSVSTYYLVIVTYGVGAGLSFIPLLVYLCVVRVNRPYYLTGVLCAAVFASSFMIPTNAFLATILSITLYAIVFYRLSLKVILAVGCVALVVLLNWSEPLFALASNVSLSDKAISTPAGFISNFKTSIYTTFLRLLDIKAYLLSVPVILLLWFQKNPIWSRSICLLAGPVLFVILLESFPWEKVHLAFLNSLSVHYTLLAIPCLLPPLLAQAASARTDEPRPQHWANRFLTPLIVTHLIFAIAIGLLINLKVNNFLWFLYNSGQSHYHSTNAAQSKSWLPKTPVRVITLRTPDLGPEPNLAYGIYGLDTFDTFLLLPQNRQKVLWESALLKEKNGWSYYVDWQRWHDGAYDPGDQFSTDLLRLANVGYILSPLPFKSGPFELVYSPEQPPITRDLLPTQPIRYLKNRISRLTTPNGLYVYKIRNPMPRVYSAQNVRLIDKSVDDGSFLDIISKHEIKNSIYARPGYSEHLDLSKSSIKVLDFELDKDRMQAQIETKSGGNLIFNAVYSPFWKASANGKDLMPIPVNYIQMAVKVPAGATQVTFRYERKSLIETIRNLMKAGK